MELLIILIIFVKFFLQIAQNNKKANQKNQSVPNQRRQPDRPIQKMAQKQPSSQQIWRETVSDYQKQKQTKERLQQKYGSKQASLYQNQMLQKSDILSRAKENVKETEPNIIKQQIHAEVCTDYRNIDSKKVDVEVHKKQAFNCDKAEESDILKKVNDLIVMGYSGEMHFERDFISEGVELLNHYSL